MTDLVGFGYRRSREHDPTSGVDADTNVSPRPVLLRRSDVATPSTVARSDRHRSSPIGHVTSLPSRTPRAPPPGALHVDAHVRPRPPPPSRHRHRVVEPPRRGGPRRHRHRPRRGGGAVASARGPRQRRAGPRPSARLSGVRGVAARLDARAIGRPPRPRRRQRGVRRRRWHAHRDLVHRRRRPHLGSHRARRRRRRPGAGGRRARRRQPLGPQRHEHPRLLSPADVDGVLRVVGARPPGCPRAHLVGRAGADPTARRPPRRPVPPPPRPRRRAPPRDGADER